MCEKRHNVVILQPEFLPWRGFFEQIALADVFVHYDDVQLSTNNKSRTNKIQIKIHNGITQLTVPIKKSKEQKISETLIDNTQNWKIKHRKTFDVAFKKSLFFNDAKKIFDEIYENNTDFICEFNIFAIEKVANYFELETVFLRSSDLESSQHKSTARLLEICQSKNSTHYITGLGAKNYIDYDIFESANIKIEFMQYDNTPYPQMFGEFTPYVTIFDLIANCGKDGRKYIASKSVYWKNFTREG